MLLLLVTSNCDQYSVLPRLTIITHWQLAARLCRRSHSVIFPKVGILAVTATVACQVDGQGLQLADRGLLVNKCDLLNH